MSLINSKVRFAVDESDGRVFCYETNRYYAPTGELTAPDGVWDLAKVKAAVLAGTSLQVALLSHAQPVDAVAQANADFETAVETEIAKQHAAANAAHVAQSTTPIRPPPAA